MSTIPDPDLSRIVDFTLTPSDRWATVSATEKKVVWYEWCTRSKFADGGIVTPFKLALFLWDYVIPRHWLGNVQPDKKRARAAGDVDDGRECLDGQPRGSVKRVKSERGAAEPSTGHPNAQSVGSGNVTTSINSDRPSVACGILEVAEWSDAKVIRTTEILGEMDPDAIAGLAELADYVNVKGTEKHKAAHVLRRVWRYPLAAGVLAPCDLTILDIHDDQVRTGVIDASEYAWDAVDVIIEAGDDAAVTYADDGFDPDWTYDTDGDTELSHAIFDAIRDGGIANYAMVKMRQEKQRRQQLTKSCDQAA